MTVKVRDHDPVFAPAHYAGDGEVECKRAMRSMAAGYDRSLAYSAEATYWCITAFKYLWRWPLKNGLQDLRKARECIDQALEAAGRKQSIHLDANQIVAGKVPEGIEVVPSCGDVGIFKEKEGL